MRVALIGVIIFVLSNNVAVAQAVDNMASFRAINSKRYVRLHYENDFFTGHDLYYTQGVNLEFVNPTYGKLFINRLLAVPKRSERNYGVSLEHNAYTPTSITHTEILYGDRPFAADVFLKFFSFGVDSSNRSRFVSSFSIGMIGKVASGYTIQKTIHGWLNTTPPKGWNNQIANDLIINYELGYEKNLVSKGNFFLLNGTADAKVGTLSDKVSAGFVIMLGRMNHSILSNFATDKNSRKRKFNAHLYAQPLLNLVGYDATLQGGVFTKSPYTLSFEEVTHLTAQINYGIVSSYRSLTIEYFKTAITREFSTGGNHRWGGLRLAVAF